MGGFEGRHLSIGPPPLVRGRVTRGAPGPWRTWAGNRAWSRRPTRRRRGLARRRTLPDREAWTGRRGLPGREGVAGRDRLAWPHPARGGHGRLGRSARGARRPARARGRGRSGLVSGPRWRGPRASRRRRRGRRAARCGGRHGRPEPLPSTWGAQGPHGPLGSVEAGGSCRAGRGGWRARVAGNVDQATLRIHVRRVQCPSPRPARPLVRRPPVPVTGAAAARPGPGERENQQGDQAHREARHA